MKHYRPRIEEDLKEVTANNYKCPICDYMGKDKQTIYRHYTGKHKVVEKYLADDIAEGTVIPLAHKSYHGEDPLYKACEICGEVVHTFTYQKHMKRCHNKN